MRKWVAALAMAGAARAAVGAPPETTRTEDDRLPSTVAPERYALTLAPDLARGTFRGSETIDVAVRAPTKAIVLHAVDLGIGDATVEAAGAKLRARVERDRKRGTVTLVLPREIPVGKAAIRSEERRV